MRNTSSTDEQKSKTVTYHYGLKGWNFYFLVKFGLLWFGYLNFNLFENLLFLAFLLLPLPWIKASYFRYISAIPVGVALLYYDSWLPSIGNIWEQKEQLINFSASYIYDLIIRFINLKMIATGFIFFIFYFFASQWIRFSTFIIVGMFGLTIPDTIKFSSIISQTVAKTPVQDEVSLYVSSEIKPEQSQSPTDENLNKWLEQFYDYENKRNVVFPNSLTDESQPFDLLMINICSLSWDDLNEVNLSAHPIWKRFDILFDNFNSATSYSGPASIRLLRASCGQPSHRDLYSYPDNQCYLLDNLVQLGFKEYLIMDHKGEYGNYLNGLRDYAGLRAPLESNENISHQITAFDGTPIYNDKEILHNWLKTIESSDNKRTATFFNLIPLHDGNRSAKDKKIIDYHESTRILLDQLEELFDELERSGRKVMIVVAPEHGAALTGDKIQMAGLRDIPNPAITKVPVGIKFIGIKSAHPTREIIINQPSSYLAISELVARIVDGKVFSDESVDWSKLTENLPVTASVSENANSIVINYQGKYYVRMNKGKWIPYPNTP